jgi:hypothetical protein
MVKRLLRAERLDEAWTRRLMSGRIIARLTERGRAIVLFNRRRPIRHKEIRQAIPAGC